MYTPEEFCDRVGITPQYLRKLMTKGFSSIGVEVGGKESHFYDRSHILMYFWALKFCHRRVPLERAIEAASARMDNLIDEAEHEIKIAGHPG